MSSRSAEFHAWAVSRQPALDLALDVCPPQVVEQPAAAAVEHLQATTAVVVQLVRLEMVGDVGDPAGQQGDLDLRRTGVAFEGRVLLHDLRFDLGFESQRIFLC